jgi:TolB-like protein
MSEEQATSAINLSQEATFVLGSLEVRPPTCELVVAGRSEALEPKIMQVLVALARRRGQVVSRDELVVRCWDGRIVSEDAINRSISAVRRLAKTHGGFAIHTVTRVGYRLDADELDGRAAEPRPEPLLAVLAFDNLSGDPETAYFSDGVSEEILQTVARGADLKVIGRTSSFQLRGSEKAIRKVVADLKATHVLDGSVRRSGSKVRIAANLIECEGQTTLWSDRYDRDLADVFALWDEIAVSVAAALKTEFAHPGGRPSKLDPSAYDLFLRARDFSIFRPTAERVAMFEQCVALAPDFAEGWAWLAFERAIHLRYERGDLALAPLAQAARSALATAERLDPAMGFTRKVREALEPPAAYQRREALLREALRLSPDDPVCLTCTADLLGEVGRLREALALAEEAKSRDPLLPSGTIWSQGDRRAVVRWVSLLENYQEQAAQFDAMLAKWPANPDTSVAAASYAAAYADWPRYEAFRRHVYAQGFHERMLATVQGTLGFWDAIRDGDRAVLSGIGNSMLSQALETGTVQVDVLAVAGHAGQLEAAYQAVDRAAFDNAFELGGQPVSTWWPGIIFQRAFSAALIDDARFPRFCAKLGLVHYWLETNCWPDCADEVPYDFRAEARKAAAEGLARQV